MNKNSCAPYILAITFFIVYFCLSLFTFGHAHNKEKMDFLTLVTMVSAGTIWPVYWSAELQKKEACFATR